jgi:hypothetical protein
VRFGEFEGILQQIADGRGQHLGIDNHLDVRLDW